MAVAGCECGRVDVVILVCAEAECAIHPPLVCGCPLEVGH